MSSTHLIHTNRFTHDFLFLECELPGFLYGSTAYKMDYKLTFEIRSKIRLGVLKLLNQNKTKIRFPYKKCHSEKSLIYYQIVILLE